MKELIGVKIPGKACKCPGCTQTEYQLIFRDERARYCLNCIARRRKTTRVRYRIRNREKVLATWQKKYWSDDEFREAKRAYCREYQRARRGKGRVSDITILESEDIVNGLSQTELNG